MLTISSNQLGSLEGLALEDDIQALEEFALGSDLEALVTSTPEALRLKVKAAIQIAASHHLHEVRDVGSVLLLAASQGENFDLKSPSSGGLFSIEFPITSANLQSVVKQLGLVDE
jgi:hypothetical protein